jgi:alkylated DNA repair protein (DNA oxidative demethylase)
MRPTERNVASRRSRIGTSRLGGVPTIVPNESSAVPALFSDYEQAPTRRHDVAPGVVLISGWLSLAEQRSLVEQFRMWALPPAGLRHPRMPSGHLMSVQSVCLGWHWQPYAYTRTADDTDAAPVKPLPPDIAKLGRRAVADTFGAATAESFAPDAVIANLYASGSRLGLHQDAEEPSEAPVVTISVGDSCVFRMAGVDRRTAPFTDLRLRSGDLLVFGGPARRVHHGVPKVYDGTGPQDLGLPGGRLSLTIRETGLND